MSRRGARAVSAAVGTFALGAAGGCDPCQTVGGCTTGARVSETVQVIEHATGRPVGGTRVVLVRTGGARLERDTLAGVTGADGMLTLRVGAREAGDVFFSADVTPPPRWPAYRVGEVRVSTYSGRGNGGILGRWVVDPYLEFVGELHDLRTGGRLGEAQVSFVRRSGPEITPGILSAVSEPGSGRFFWEPRVVGFGPIVGDLRVDHPSRAEPVVLRGVALRPDYIDRPPAVIGVFEIP